MSVALFVCMYHGASTFVRKQGKYETSMYKPLWHHACTRPKEDIKVLSRHGIKRSSGYTQASLLEPFICSCVRPPTPLWAAPKYPPQRNAVAAQGAFNSFPNVTGRTPNMTQYVTSINFPSMPGLWSNNVTDVYWAAVVSALTCSCRPYTAQHHGLGSTLTACIWCSYVGGGTIHPLHEAYA